MIQNALKRNQKLKSTECLLLMSHGGEHAAHYNEASISSETVFEHLTQLLLIGLYSRISVKMSQHVPQRHQRAINLLLNRRRHFCNELARYFDFSCFFFRLHLSNLLSQSSVKSSQIYEREAALAPSHTLTPRDRLHCQCKH